MPQLTPQQPFNFVWQLGDPSDFSTNFVQIVVRDSASNKTIATVKLTDKGGQRFVGIFTPPADISGNGYYLDVTITVYTDSNYSVLSQNYPIATLSALVLQQLTVGMGTGGGDDGVTEYILRKVLQEFFDKNKESGGEEFTVDDIDFSPILDGHKAIMRSIAEKNFDVSPLKKTLEQLEAMVKTIIKEISKEEEKEEVDLYPVISGIQNLVDLIDATDKSASKRHALLPTLEEINDSIEEHIEKVAEQTKSSNKDNSGVIRIELASAAPSENGKKYDLDPRVKSLLP